jgi:hypothetical protein
MAYVAEKEKVEAASAVATGVVDALIDFVMPKEWAPWLYSELPVKQLPNVNNWVVMLGGLGTWFVGDQLRRDDVKVVGEGSMLYSVPKFVYALISKLVSYPPVTAAAPAPIAGQQFYVPPVGAPVVVPSRRGKYLVTG